MPVEIRELIVKAVVNNEELSTSPNAVVVQADQAGLIAEAVEQLKRMMSDSKER
ncbi:MAG: hypothetical protein IM638_12770 [Bacteroidetes bacterium]|nr:hypothetical protein [Bacteroidota bacterium]